MKFVEIIRCNRNLAVLHGHFPSIHEKIVGTVVSLYCDNGYQIQGNNTNYTCSIDGSWKGTAQCGTFIKISANIFLVSL